MKKLKKKTKIFQTFSSDEIQNFSCEIQEFKEIENQGQFTGLLVNMQTSNSAKGVYRFQKGSMKLNDGKKLFLQYNHYGNILPVGTLVGEETEKGFEVVGQFHLSKDDNGNYINPEAVKLYSLMKEMKINFEMSVGGAITEYKEVIENGKFFIDIYKFEAYEGSLTPKGAVKGSKVTKVFNENIGGKKMDEKQLELLLKGILENFKGDLLKAGTPEELQKLPEQFKDLEATFDKVKENLEADLKESFSKQINELNDVIKGLKADFKATPKAVSIAEQFAAMIEETEKNGASVEVVFKPSTEINFSAENTGSSTGKAIVKTEYVNKILERIQEANPVLKDIDFISIADGSLTIPREVAGLPETGWVGESEERTETSTTKIDNVTIPLYQLYALPAVTNKLLATNFVGYANFLLKRIEYALSLTLANAVFSGTGVNMPLGILKDPKVTQQKEIDTTDDASFVDSIIDIYYSVREEIAKKAKWHLTRETWARISKLKNTRKDFYITDLNTGNSRTLMSRPVEFVESEKAEIKGIDVANPTTDVVAVFAALSEAMMGIQNDKMTMRLEAKLTSKGLTKFYIEKGVGVGVQLPEYIVKVVKKA